VRGGGCVCKCVCVCLCPPPAAWLTCPACVDVCGYVSTMLRARSAATCVILLTFVALSSTGMAVCACVRACVNAIGHNTASFGDVQASASQPPDPH